MKFTKQGMKPEKSVFFFFFFWQNLTCVLSFVMCASLSALFIGLVPKLFVYVYVCIKHLFGVFDILKHDNYCQAPGNKIVNFLILGKILLQAFSSLQ